MLRECVECLSILLDDSPDALSMLFEIVAVVLLAHGHRLSWCVFQCFSGVVFRFVYFSRLKPFGQFVNVERPDRIEDRFDLFLVRFCGFEVVAIKVVKDGRPRRPFVCILEQVRRDNPPEQVRRAIVGIVVIVARFLNDFTEVNIRVRHGRTFVVQVVVFFEFIVCCHDLLSAWKSITYHLSSAYLHTTPSYNLASKMVQSYKCIAVIGLDAMVELTQKEWIRMAPLTERKAEALYRRHVERESRKEAAEAMGCSPSNVDNLERSARSDIISAKNLVSLADAIDAGPDKAIIGMCAECDQPTSVLVPEDDPDGPMLCEACADE